MSHDEGIDYCGDDCHNHWKREADRLRAELSQMTARAQSFATALAQRDDAEAKLARVRELCETKRKTNPESGAVWYIVLAAIEEDPL
jgi:hypothetical protein